jgi:hypothetical protein
MEKQPDKNRPDFLIISAAIVLLLTTLAALALYVTTDFDSPDLFA